MPKPASPTTIREVFAQRVTRELAERRALENRERELQSQLMEYEPYLEREWVKSILIGGTSSPLTDPSRMLERLGWKNAQFMMLALEIKRQGRMEGISVRDWHLFRFAVGNTVEELAGQDGARAYFLEPHSHHMALLLYKPLTWPTEAFRSEVLALAGRIISSVHRFLKVKRTSVPVFARTTGLPSPTPPKKRFKHSPSGTNRMSPIPVSTYTAKAASGVQRRGTYGRCDFSRR